MAFDFPKLDPVALSVGPLNIRWYSLAYIAGFLLAWLQLRQIRTQSPTKITAKQIDDSIFWIVLGVILGGRLGYVLFYNLDYYWLHPLEIIGFGGGNSVFSTGIRGMSFHGGLIGVTLAVVLYCRKQRIPLPCFSDLLACVVPIGLFFGRVANFINAELYGRVTDVSWGVIFPNGGPFPRHPSQLYEAVFEGLVLYAILNLVRRKGSMIQSPGKLTGLFLILYGLFRFMIEFFREPDVQLGFIFSELTMGQILSIPVILVGVGFFAMGMRQKLS